MARKLAGQFSDQDTDAQVSTDPANSDPNEANEANTTEENETMTTLTPEAEATDSTPVEPTADPTAETSGEATDQAAADAAAVKAKEAAEAEAAYATFEQAVKAGIDGRDPSTGTVPEALTTPVTESYRALNVGGKSKAKAHLLAIMQTGVESSDLSTAMAASQLSKVLTPAKAAAKPKEEKAPADPTEAVATQLAVLKTAFVYIQSNLPEGVDSEAVKAKTNELVEASGTQMQSYIDWLNREPVEDGATDTPEPEGINAVTKKAVKLALTKVRVSTSTSSGASGDGVRRSVSKHISQVFADKASGDFMTIAEIANADSEEYAGVKISSGAITARLYPSEGECTLKDVVPATVGGKRGATKV